MNIYRKLTVATQALEPFTSSEFAFEMRGQENLGRSIHPSDERDLDYLNSLQIRDTFEDYEQLVLNTVRGVLKYALQGEDNPKKNLPHLQRFVFTIVIVFSPASLYLSSFLPVRSF